MSFEPILSVTGNLVADPELRFTQGGKAVCSMRMASTPRTKNKDTQVWEDGTTLWLKLTAWGQQGENCAESLSKGMKVVVVGRLTQRDWTDKEGNTRSSLEIQVDSIGPELGNAQATVRKISRSGAQQGQYGAQGAPVADPWMTPPPQQQQQQYAPAAGQQHYTGQQNPYPQPQQRPQHQPLPLAQWNQPQQGDPGAYRPAAAPQMPAAAPSQGGQWNDDTPPF